MISVVIPTFNRAALIGRSIESVFAQTYKNYEVIVIDDGSLDNTREILKPYGQRIRYFYQNNRGASAAQNKGIEVAKGEWISVLASDDEWLPTKLERQVEVLEAFGEDSGACFTDCQFVGNSDLKQTAFELGGLGKSASIGFLDDPLRYVLGRDPVIYVQSLLVRRSLLKELVGFDEAMVVAEDTDLLLRLALKTKFCFVAEPLVKIDRTPAQARLMELFAVKSDKMFSSKEHMYKKWVRLPELVDPVVRAQTRENLRGLYHDWMIRDLYQFKFSEAFAKMRQAIDAGDSYLRIISKLAFRAARKTCAPLTRQVRSAAQGTPS